MSRLADLLHSWWCSFAFFGIYPHRHGAYIYVESITEAEAIEIARRHLGKGERLDLDDQ